MSAQGEERGLEGKMDGLGLVAAGEGEAGGEVTEVRVMAMVTVEDAEGSSTGYVAGWAASLYGAVRYQ